MENKKRGAPAVRTVFGAYGYTECEMLVPVGRARLRVRFQGGAVSAFGVVPARFETSNPVLQAAIRRSPQYKSGRIRTVSETPIKPTPAP